jgi:hypothetical protein
MKSIAICLAAVAFLDQGRGFMSFDHGSTCYWTHDVEKFVTAECQFAPAVSSSLPEPSVCDVLPT